MKKKKKLKICFCLKTDDVFAAMTAVSVRREGDKKKLEAKKQGRKGHHKV